jgi:AbrB family transcriptional regulator, transcriptional pleiotropic regulator of transition state genes
MLSTNFVQNMNEQGWLVIPTELMSQLSIEAGDSVEFNVEGECITIKKCFQACVFCMNTENLTKFNGKFICSSCLSDV